MSGYIDPRGMYYPPDQPYLAYGPGQTTRLVRSQHAWNGHLEIEDLYKGSQTIAGWSAARPDPNLVPFLGDSPRFGNRPTYRYNLPGGPTQPKQLLQQLTVPPTFPAGDWRIYDPMRYAVPWGAPGGDGSPGGGGYGGGMSAPAMARAVAAGLKQAMPELATSIGVQVARGNAQQTHTPPANLAPPVRAWEFAESPLTPVSVSDGTFILVTEHVVPVGAVAVANLLEVQAESGAGLMDTEVQIRVGGSAVPRYSSMNAPDLGSPGEPAPINIKAIEQQRIQVFARARTVAAIHNITAVLRGWDTAPSLNTNLESIAAWRGQ